jgi:hypothetical protein
MKELPTEDPLFGKGTIRADGRKVPPGLPVRGEEAGGLERRMGHFQAAVHDLGRGSLSASFRRRLSAGQGIMSMNPAQLRAIDVHTHAEVSAREPMDELWKARTEAMAKYFKGATDRPTVTDVAAYYRERRIGCVIFPVDSERASGERRVALVF